MLFETVDIAAKVRELHAAAQGIAALQVLVVTPAGSSFRVEAARSVVDVQGLLAQRYDGRRGTLVLLRPDQHVCARWRGVSGAPVRQALRRALALPEPN